MWKHRLMFKHGERKKSFHHQASEKDLEGAGIISKPFEKVSGMRVVRLLIGVAVVLNNNFLLI